MADFEFVLDTLDELPDDAAKALYKEKDGKFQLDLNAYGEFVKAPVVAKNKDLLKVNARNKELTATLEKFKDIDDDALEAFQKWKEEQANSNGHKPPAEVADLQAKYQQEITQREKKLKEAHAKEKETLEQKLEAVEAEKDAFILQTKGVELFGKAKGDPESLDLLLMALPKHFKLNEKKQLVPIDDDGDPLPEDAESYFAGKFKSKYKGLFLSEEIGGSGPEGNRGAKPKSNTITRAQFNAMSQEERHQATVVKGKKVVD